MNLPKSLGLAAMFVLLLPSAPVSAQESTPVATNADHREIAMRVANDFARPRYDALLASFSEQADSWTRFCAESATGDAADLTARFASAVHAWSRIELVRYGPISGDFRYERIAYWPERKNDVARSLARLLADETPPTPEAMPAKSVAVQGLSALERLLHDESAQQALASGAESARRCQAGTAISANLRIVAQQIVDGWPALLDRLNSDPTLAREAVTRFATDLLTIFQITGDQKLDVPMGKTPAEARPKSAQWWRSGLSASSLALNLRSAADLTAALLGPSDTTESVAAIIATGERVADTLPHPLHEMVADETQRSRLLLLRDAVRGARDLAGQNVPPALGITLGFNSLDGD